MITKRLIFHFYVKDGWEDNPIYKLHQYLLRRYSNIFNEALFVIAVDDVDNYCLINLAKKFLIDCNFKNIEFRVEKNDSLYEVSTFDKYIVKGMDKLDGMTFFAHSKGTNDIYEKDKDGEAIIKWIIGLYYLSLEYYKEGEKAMFGTNLGTCFYGPFMGVFDTDEERVDKHFPKNGVMYIGTYYWLNCKEIYATRRQIIPEVYNRFYAENFPGSICRAENYEMFSHDYRYMSSVGTRNLIFQNEGLKCYLDWLFLPNELEEFNKLYSIIIKELELEEVIKNNKKNT